MTVTASFVSGLNIVDTDNPTFPQQNQFQGTQTLTSLKGPSPGAITATVVGVQPDLSELTLGGPALFQNQSTTEDNLAIVGIWDGDSFFPLFDIPPGKTMGPVWLSAYLGEEMTSGTGTVSSAGTLMVKMLLESATVVILGYDP